MRDVFLPSPTALFWSAHVLAKRLQRELFLCAIEDQFLSVPDVNELAH